MILALTGGFLGSGKTTAITEACRSLMDKGIQTAVITNDQGIQQVDSALTTSEGIPTAEVAGGCFCCQFNKLQENLQYLVRTVKPEIIFAESLGTCADLVATVVKPINRLDPEVKVVVSIFADAAYVKGLLDGSLSFQDENVRYLYQKQLEEADLIMLNKSDLLTTEQMNQVVAFIGKAYPGKEVSVISSLSTSDIGNWIDLLSESSISTRPSLDINYDIYGAGEAVLAWFDKELEIQSPTGDAIRVALQAIHMIHQQLISLRVLIGHLKFFIQAPGWSQKISITPTGASHSLRQPVPSAASLRMMINARVQTSPERLSHVVEDALQHTVTSMQAVLVPHTSAAFAPGFPRPTYRIA
ncbi:MAG: hypothetical protein JST14_17725 [Bacteroidetes bacterium]|nr:hypothetical protein [Bacteroidota bacterium]